MSEIQKILNPFSSYEAIQNCHVREEFSKMSAKHQAITVVAVAFIGLVTLTIGAPFYLPLLVARFRHYEQSKSKPQGLHEVISKTDDVGRHTIPQPSTSTEQPVSTSEPFSIPQPAPTEQPVPTSEPFSIPQPAPTEQPAPTSEPFSIPQPVSTEQPFPRTEELVANMLDDIAYDDEVRTFLTKASRTAETAAIAFLAHYESKKNLKISEEERGDLFMALLEILNPQFTQETKKDEIERFPFEGGTITVHPTVGDGSCGIHALVGSPDKSKVYRSNATEKRFEFCLWLRACFEAKALPNHIEDVLRDFFLVPAATPKEISAKLGTELATFASLKETFASLPEEERNVKQERILHDLIYPPKVFDIPNVFTAYYDYLQKESTYLLQEELVAAAQYFDVNLIIVQPEPGMASTELKRTYVNAQDPREPIYIYYNGHNHFARAFVEAPNNPATT